MDSSARSTLKPDEEIPWLRRLFRAADPNVVAGVADDDCGTFRLGDEFLVLSTDFLNSSPISEQTGLGDDRTLGRLAVAATISDLLGSGALPRVLLVALTVPYDYPKTRFREVMRGVKAEARRWNVAVVGGDTKLGPARALLTCGVGSVGSPKELLLTRNAKPGDTIMVSGCLGTCAAAALLASRHSEEATVPRWVRHAITVPDLPVAKSRALAQLKLAGGGIDISDGLGTDLHHLCSTSRVGAVIELSAIPVRPIVRQVAKTLKVSPWAFAFACGGDFQFLATVPTTARGSLAGLGFVEIGTVTRGKGVRVRNETGRTVRLPSVGHRDRKGVTFGEEVLEIVRQVTIWLNSTPHSASASI